MNCPKCGAPNPNGAPYCTTCGSPLPAAPQQPYGQPQQGYGQPQYQQQAYGMYRQRPPFQWYDARLPLVKRINRSALEAIVAYFLCMFMPIISEIAENSSTGFSIFDCTKIDKMWKEILYVDPKIGSGGFIAMWIIDLIVVIGALVVSTLGIHLGTIICGGVLFITSLMTLIFGAVDANQIKANIGIGAIFMLLLSMTIIGLGVWEFLKFQKKQKMGR